MIIPIDPKAVKTMVDALQMGSLPVAGWAHRAWVKANVPSVNPGWGQNNPALGGKSYEAEGPKADAVLDALAMGIPTQQAINAAWSTVQQATYKKEGLLLMFALWFEQDLRPMAEKAAVKAVAQTQAAEASKTAADKAQAMAASKAIGQGLGGVVVLAVAAVGAFLLAKLWR